MRDGFRHGDRLRHIVMGVLLIPLAAGAEVVPSPRWPLDLAERYLTSNFMEYRSGRYHAGLDLKTREASGFAARAVEDGWIVRVRALPSGYGRVIYLRGDSGRTYVYGHLERFNDQIGARVATEQARLGAYRVELEFAPGEMRVVRDDVLGLTGQSGAVGPHLHFEVRDSANRLLDPQAVGFAVRDTFPPVIHHLRALPAAAGARLQGAATALRLPVAGRNWAGGQGPPLSVKGPIAFSASIIDAADIAGHRLEPWLIELHLDGELVYRSLNDSFDLAENAQQRLEWLECGPARDRWLFREAAVTVAGREGTTWHLGPVGQGLEPGVHRLELVASDRADNRSTVAWDVIVEADTEPTGSPAATSAAGWERDAVEVVFAVNANENIVLYPLFDVIPDSMSPGALVRLQAGPQVPVLRPVSVASGVAVLTEAQRGQAKAQGLVPLGEGARWAAASWPIEASPVFCLPGTVGGAVEIRAADVEMYRWTGSSWTAAGTVLASDSDLECGNFAVAKPGLHAAMRDRGTPRVAAGVKTITVGPAPRGRVPGVRSPRWEVFPVSVADDGSGIAPESIAARWDGEPLIIEPDLLRNRVLVELPDAATPGAHVLELSVKDKAGNPAKARLAVEIVAGAKR